MARKTILGICVSSTYTEVVKPEDHWSCIAHLSAEDMLKSVVIEEKKFNQRTSGPVNAHMTSGPGIYFNTFIHVYSPKAGADNPLGTNVDVNTKPLSLCPFAASFKTISLKYDFNTF